MIGTNLIGATGATLRIVALLTRGYRSYGSLPTRECEGWHSPDLQRTLRSRRSIPPLHVTATSEASCCDGIGASDAPTLTIGAVRVTLRRPVHAAGDVERHCGSRLRGPLPGPKSPCDAPLPAFRDPLRRGQGAVGGALRAPLRVLARLRRRAGAAVSGLRALRERLRPDPVSRMC